MCQLLLFEKKKKFKKITGKIINLDINQDMPKVKKSWAHAINFLIRLYILTENNKDCFCKTSLLCMSVMTSHLFPLSAYKSFFFIYFLFSYPGSFFLPLNKLSYLLYRFLLSFFHAGLCFYFIFRCYTYIFFYYSRYYW